MKDKAPIDHVMRWLGGAPRTYGWNAILAYDRDKTNTVLRQEYIERFDAGSYLPAFEGLIPTTDGSVEYLHDYVLDAARLSFINSSIASSRAMMTQKVIGGSQLSLIKPLGALFPRVEKVSSLDAMDGPVLEAVIYLRESPGVVDEVTGEVILDISLGEFYRLTFARTEEERKKGGRFFQERFGDLLEPQKQLVLNRLIREPDQFLKPASFEIRTHAAPNSRTPGTQEYGSGAVLVFITMENEGNGSIPTGDKDLPFLIPDGHSATMLLGQDFLVRNIYDRGCRAIANGGGMFDYEVIYAGLFLKELRALSGRARIGRRTGSSLIYELLQIDDLNLPLADANSSFSIIMESNNLTVRLRGNAEQAMQVKLRDYHLTYKHDVTVFWDVTSVYGPVLHPATGTIEFSLVPQKSFTRVRVKPGNFGNENNLAWRLDDIVSFAEEELRSGIAEKLSTFIDAVGAIDAFRLNSLLFKGENAVVLKNIYTPGDMGLFGDVAPHLTEFVISPLEPLMGHGQVQAFTVEPPRLGITWSVHALPGDSGPIGSIDADGKYTAPRSSEIEGVYKRLLVRASRGTHTSTALVTVVVRDISVNPLIQTCSPRDSRAMSAGGLGQGVLSWAIADPDSTASVIPSMDPDGDHVFLAGEPDLLNPFRIEEVVVTNGLTQARQSAWVLVITGTMGLEVTYQPTARPDQVQCKAYFAGTGDPLDGIPLVWEMKVGSGSLDDDGLFTIDPGGHHRFAVITCSVPMPPPFPSYLGFCILPLPLIPLPDVLHALDASALLLTPPSEE
ncbi:hypothetical protein [Pseudomonas sp. zfem002]|uniref:hypothetical protein n=1 Tax=Pseudomonas sp. zfem002 TaxID=3078197 RepID=UPI002929C030|nr:hypothetical protein [Pseudomonas sp. zfem002]MDU9389391.1 hypothetical protein [Pseudomonas sp. zfem002]